MRTPIFMSVSLCLCGGLLTGAELVSTASSMAPLAQALTAPTLVDPTLQPFDLFDRYMGVLWVSVEAVDNEAGTVSLAVRRVLKGDFAATRIQLRVAVEQAKQPLALLIEPGLEFAVFLGLRGRGRHNNLLFYVGGQGQWQLGVMADPGSAEKPAAWDWTDVIAKSDEQRSKTGAFNGDPARLATMLAEYADGQGYFPAEAHTRFAADQVLAAGDSPYAGVALFDIDGDGRVDALGASEAGISVLRQGADGAFTDVSAATGLAVVSGRSLGIADANGDGR
nr:VCBS repeat-containing protein [Planctomycetota bacterium]